MSREVTIDLDTYNNLLIKSNDLDMILNCIYENARLSYHKSFITADGEILSHLIKSIDYQCYNTCLRKLQKEEENENE